jgi:hypothetical protein
LRMHRTGGVKQVRTIPMPILIAFALNRQAQLLDLLGKVL